MAAKYEQSYIFNADMNGIRAVIYSPNFASHLNIIFKSENPMQYGYGVWFRFHHGTTFTSWGEKITITLEPLDQFTTRVTILSECGMPTQVIDWGKNKQIVCNVYEHIVRLLGTYTPPAYNTAQQAPQMVYCPHCGAQYPVGTPFCTVCGMQLQ